MSSSIVHHPDSPPKATAARVSDEQLVVALADGRELTVPLAWFDWLASAAPSQRVDLEIVESGRGIWWPSLDDGLSVAVLMGVSEGA
jgi:hypothetical protein